MSSPTPEDLQYQGQNSMPSYPANSKRGRGRAMKFFTSSTARYETASATNTTSTRRARSFASFALPAWKPSAHRMMPMTPPMPNPIDEGSSSPTIPLKPSRNERIAIVASAPKITASTTPATAPAIHSALGFWLVKERCTSTPKRMQAGYANGKSPKVEAKMTRGLSGV